MQCYPSYAMYWAVLAAANWATGQVNCQGQLSSNIAAYCQGTTLLHSKESQETLIRIYIYYIYLQKLYIYYIYLQKLYINYIYVCVCVCPYLIPLIMKALPSNIHSLKSEWKTKVCHSNNQGNETP